MIEVFYGVRTCGRPLVQYRSVGSVADRVSMQPHCNRLIGNAGLETEVQAKGEGARTRSL